MPRGVTTKGRETAYLKETARREGLLFVLLVFAASRPLYPLLMRSFAELFGGPVTWGALSVWGPLISLAALPFALFFVYRIAEEHWDSGVARGAVLALALFPTAFFLNAAYTESLFLALSAGSLWAARVRRDLLLACALAGLATTVVRAYGSAAEGAGRLLDGRLWSDPSLARVADHLAGAANLYNLLFFLFAVVVLLAGLRDLPPDLALYAFLLVLPAALFGTPQNPLMGAPRYVLVAFPLFIVLGLLHRNRPVFVTGLVLSTTISLVFCALFVTWRFVA